MTDINSICQRQKEYFHGGKTFDITFRKQQLLKLKLAIKKHESDIYKALCADLGKSETEAYMCEVGLTLSEIQYQYDHVSRFSKPSRRRTPLANFHSKSYTVREPYGRVLIMSPWNYPFMLCMEPLAGAIAAGNCCVVKPSAYSPETSAVIRSIIEETFEPEYIAAVEGGRNENTALLEQKFDYIFFTGSVSVGKLVMQKAAANLTPVTLELGGKSPCVVDKGCSLKLAARRIAFGKYLNCGQTCVAPDYALVHRDVKDEFLRLLKDEIKKMYTENPLENGDYGKIINHKHFDRINALIDKSKVVYGGKSDAEKCKIEPTVMDNVTENDAVMGEEIFGPVLPVITVGSMREAEEFISKREKPLALYLFTSSKDEEKRFTRFVSFGGGCINDTVVHLATSDMPFGGVGNSGMGAYHGKDSFNTFSHEKSILKKYCLIDMPMRYQPYKELYLKLIKLFLH